MILPFIVLRHIDSVLAPTKPQVLQTQNRYGDQQKHAKSLLRNASGYAFYNTSLYDFDSLLGDHEHLTDILCNYITELIA